MTYTIYALLDPRGNVPCYVGATSLPLLMRLDYHVKSARDHQRKDSKNKWFRHLLTLGILPQIKGIETVQEIEGVAARETHWINKLRKSGHQLTNMNKGGGGICHRGGPSQDILNKLGKVRDTALAKEAGVTRPAVRLWRKKRQIPAFRPEKPAARPAVPTTTEIIDEVKSLDSKVGTNIVVVNAGEYRARGSHFLDRVSQGDVIILTRHGRPVAFLVGYYDLIKIVRAG